MPNEKLEAEPVHVLPRFEHDVQLACPLFQRRYVWDTGNIETFWQDIRTIIDGEYSKRFLGTLVFDCETDTTASSAGRYWIIDGQQRLTTIYLILVAIAVEATQLGDAGRKHAVETFTTYLLSKRENTKGQPRLSPTLIDSKQFQTLLHEASTACGVTTSQVNPSIAPGDAEGIMAAGYKFIRGRVRKYIESAVDDPTNADQVLSSLRELRDAVLERLEFVEIRLGSEHDPNEVFDRLNKAGERLGILDLVRNAVLRRLDKDLQAAQVVYNNDWVPFEGAFDDENSKANYFFPFALTLDESATKASTFKVITKHLDSVGDGEDKPDQVQEMVRTLRRHQPAYNAIHSGTLGPLNEPIRERVRRLFALNRPSSIYPYVMQLLTATAEGASQNDAARSLDVIESFLVRRAVCGIEPTGLHAVFKKLWKAAGVDPSLVREEIVSTTVRFPNDVEFENWIKTGDLYHRKVCGYLLKEYERAHTSADVLETFPPITIDHVVPQSRQGQWELDFPDPVFSELVHTWANLVPLSSEGNSTKGTANWVEARSKLQLETVFSTTKHLYDSHTEWTPETVQARAVTLAEWAIERWPSFG